MDIVSKITGNKLEAIEFNQIPTELEAGITASGQTPSAVTLNQVPIFVSRFAANNFYIDSGVANAYTLTIAASMTNPVSATVGYFEGMIIRFRAGNANTGASTVNVNSAGVKNLKKEDGSTDLEAGDIPTDRDVMFRYDGTSFVLVQNALDATTTTKGVSLLPKQIRISNNSTDTEHDLDFTAGNAQAINGSAIYSVGALTKKANATWVAGTNQGGLDTGTLANNTPYYIYAIQNLTTGVGDILFTASVPDEETKAYTGGNMPSGWGNESFVGACHTDGSANLHSMTWYYGNGIYRASYNAGSKIIALSTTSPSVSIANIKAYAPVNSIVNITASVNDNESTAFAAIFFDKGQDDATPTTSNADLIGDEVGIIVKDIQVGSDGNIRYRANDAGVDYFTVKINGWTEYL